MPAGVSNHQGAAGLGGAKHGLAWATAKSQSEVVAIVEGSALDPRDDIVRLEQALFGAVSCDGWAGEFLGGHLKPDEDSVAVFTDGLAYVVQVHGVRRTVRIGSVEHALGIAALDPHSLVYDHQVGRNDLGVAGAQLGDSKVAVGLKVGQQF